MESWKLAIVREFKNCLKRFPELKNISLIIESSAGLSGAEGKLGNKRIIILYVPQILQNKPMVLRPIIFHELSHMLNLENPDKVFMERADEKSKELWRLLQKSKTLNCIVEKKHNKGGD